MILLAQTPISGGTRFFWLMLRMNPNPMVMKTGSKTFKIVLWHMTLDATIRGRYRTGEMRIGFHLMTLDAIRYMLRFTFSTDRLVRIVTGGAS